MQPRPCADRNAATHRIFDIIKSSHIDRCRIVAKYEGHFAELLIFRKQVNIGHSVLVIGGQELVNHLLCRFDSIFKHFEVTNMANTAIATWSGYCERLLLIPQRSKPYLYPLQVAVSPL
jgi:hypothetical protein